MDIYDFIGSDWVSVTGAGDYDWEWRGVRVWYSPSARRYFWYTDSGCSCNTYGDSMRSASDFRDGDRAAVLYAVEGYGDSERAKAHIRDFSAGSETY